MIIMIPARIGSKGIPKKAIRPFLGKPLISWAIEAALGVSGARVFVNTDGDEIVNYVSANYPSVSIFIRDRQLSGDQVTLDELALEFAQRVDVGNEFLLVTLQPTSPFISAGLIGDVAQQLTVQNTGSVITVSEKKKLTWARSDDGFTPLYSARLNRQELPPIYEENGAVLACYFQELLKTETRVNQPVTCHVASEGLDYDIDTALDWRMATEYASKKKIVAILIGNEKVGSGHFHRVLSIMHYLPDFEITLIGYNLSNIFKNLCEASNYPTHFVEVEEDMIEICSEIKPGIVLLDILNTSKSLVDTIRGSHKAKVVSFEDNGEGAVFTDLTINELYPSVTHKNSILCGPEYTFLRDEFDNLDFRGERDIDILISFGGTDPNDLTIKVINWLIEGGYANKNVVIVLGLGAERQRSTISELLDEHGLSHWLMYSNVPNMAQLMVRAFLAITASGRTIYELAACRVRIVCICQNLRQLTHLFATEVNGVKNLGYFENVTEDQFLSVIKKEFLQETPTVKMDIDFSKSKFNVLSAIRNLPG